MDGEVIANEWLRDTLLYASTSPIHRLRNKAHEKRKHTMQVSRAILTITK